MTRWAGAAKHNSRLFSAYVCLLGVNVFSCCVVALQHILCDNRPGTGRPGRGGVDGTLHVCGIYIFTWTHIHVYMHVCVSGPFGYQGNGCVGLIRVSSWWRGFGSGALAVARSGGSLHLCCLGTAQDRGCGGWRWMEGRWGSECVCVCVCTVLCIKG